MNTSDKDSLREQVRSRYGGIARQGRSCCDGDCVTPDNRSVEYAVKLGYAPGDVVEVPDGSDMGLGCGNPQAIAEIKAGEIVLDLGSGGGLDCFLAARQVGPKGKVIGVDMTPEMVTRARRAAREAGYDNVEFRLGEIEHLPVADAFVDVIISNCVINLSPDKAEVFRDANRVLRPGGRLAISDVVAIRPLPDSIVDDEAAYCGCVGGAARVTEIEEMLRDAGFLDVQVKVKEDSVEIVSGWGDSYDEYVRSAIITAVKPSCME